MAINCFDGVNLKIGDKTLEQLFKERTSGNPSELELIEIGTDLAMQYHESLFNELETLRKAVNPKAAKGKYQNPFDKEKLNKAKEEQNKQPQKEQVKVEQPKEEPVAEPAEKQKEVKAEQPNVSENPALRDVESEKKQIEDFGVAKEDVEATHGLLGRVFDGLKKAGLTAAKNVGEWVGIGKGTEKPYSLKIDGKDTQVKNVQPEVVNGFYSPLEKIITESKFDKLPAKQWAEKYANSEEAKWTGLKDWLAKQQGSVSKADIQQYLKDNRIQVVEVVKGEDMPNYKLEIEPPTELGADRMDLLGDLGKAGNLDNPRFRDYLNKKYGKNGNKIYDWLVENATVEGTYSKDTKFSEYQLAGEKENYKEVLITMPEKKTNAQKNITDFFERMKAKYGEGFVGKLTKEEEAERLRLKSNLENQPKNPPFKSSHWDEPSILVHLRMNTRTDAEGKKVLFLEEVQSDWGQKGKKEGFKEDRKNDWSIKKLENDKWDYEVTDPNGKKLKVSKAPNETEQDVLNRVSDNQARANFLNDKGIPTAPFVTDTNAWTKLGLKVALKEAVKQGADKIAWSTGTQQFERWGSEEIHWRKNTERTPQEEARMKELGEKIVNYKDTDEERIEYEKLARKEGGYSLLINEQTSGATAFNGQETGNKDDLTIQTKEDLRKAIKKNLARERNDAEIDKLTDRIWNRMQTEDSGTSLPRKEGMEAFYGKPSENKLGIVGNVAKSLFKQEPKVINLKTDESKQNVGVRNTEDVKVYSKQGYSFYENGKKVDRNRAFELIEKGETLEARKEGQSTQYSIDITPELKASVEGGQPLFKDAEAQYRIESGKNIVEAIKDFNGSPRATVALTHEIMHPTVVEIFNGAKEGNETGARHANTIVEEYNKANPDKKITLEQMIEGNDAFINGRTTPEYRAVQEFIAEAWEKYHHEGAKGFSKAFQEVLDAITEVFRQVYKSLTGTTLTPELRKMFDELLGKENVSEVVKAPEISSKAKNKFSNLREKIKQKQSLKIVSDEAAYKMTEPQPPKSAPEPPKSAPSRPDKSVLTNIVNAENTPPEVKKKLTAHGLKYDPESHDEALQIARAVIDSLGIDAAVTEARARNFGGAVNTFIQTEALNALYKKEAQAKTAQEKYEAAEKFAEVSIALDEWARGDAGRGISALATFYQKSPLGMVLKENKSRKEEFNQWAKGKEESWDEFLERLNKTPEFSDYVSEKVQTELREERKKERSKFFKKVDDTLDKWINDLESGNVAFSSVVPPKLIAEALKGVKAAFKVGESATKIIGDAIDYISDKIGDNWDKDTFRAKIEKALNLRAEKTSVDRYADSLKKQIEELQKQIDAGKRDEKERKNKKEYSEEEKELQEKLKAKKAELEALSPLKNTESYKLAELDKFREKLKGLSEAEKDEVVSKAYKKLLDNGALDHADLREIIAKATGRGNLTEKQAARLQELNETINAAEIAKQKHLKERTEQTLKEYHKAIDMAAKAKRDLANEFDKKTDYLKVISSSIQGNTLGLLNVAVMNPLYNITTHLALRLPIGTVQSLFGLALGKAEMNTVFGKPMQAEFFGKGGRGFREAFKGLLTGMNKADYESKEIFSSQIRPNRSLRALLGKDNREAKMKLQEKLFHTFSVFPGATAETNFRLLNFGDKPMRYSASAATAAAFAKKYGIKFNTMDWKTFMEFPREIVKEMELAKGKSLKEAEQEAEYVVRSIEKEGERSTMQQDNFFSDMLEKVFSGGKHEGAKSLAKTLTISPFVKIPSNVLWLGYNLVHPQIALAQAAAHTIRSYGYRGKGEIAESKLQMREARYWMSVTMMGAALQAVMIPLIKAGIITAANDEDDSKKKRIADLTYQPQGMFNMTKFWAYLSGKNVNEVQGGFEIPLKYFGLPGALGNSLARDYKQLTPEQKENRRLLTDNLLELFDADDFKDIENGIFSSSSSLLQGLKGGDMTYYAGNMVNLFTNLIQPAAVSEFSRAAIPYRISGKFDSLGDKIKNDLSNRSALFRKLTGKYPKGKRNIWGEIIKKDDSYANRYFGFNNVTKDNFAQFIYEDAQKWDDEDFLPPTVSNSLGGKKLTAEQLDELEENIGLARKEFIRAYTNDIALIEELGKNYSDILGRDAKKAALQYLYQKGRKLGVDMFVSKHPEFENVVSEEEKQVEELLKNFKEINLISEDEINEKIKH